MGVKQSTGDSVWLEMAMCNYVDSILCFGKLKKNLEKFPSRLEVCEVGGEVQSIRSGLQQLRWLSCLDPDFICVFVFFGVFLKHQPVWFAKINVVCKDWAIESEFRINQWPKKAWIFFNLQFYIGS